MIYRFLQYSWICLYIHIYIHIHLSFGSFCSGAWTCRAGGLFRWTSLWATTMLHGSRSMVPAKISEKLELCPESPKRFSSFWDERSQIDQQTEVHNSCTVELICIKSVNNPFTFSFTLVVYTYFDCVGIWIVCMKRCCSNHVDSRSIGMKNWLSDFC